MIPTIRRATRADAVPLAELAARTFADTYAAYNDPADMAAHMTGKYGEAKQAEELADPAATYLLAEQDGRLLAYAYVVAGRSPGGIELEAPVELMRFYVVRSWHGRGLAQRLMDACVEEARRRGGRTLWLAVWRENPRAIAFYRKAGFRLAGATVFRLGSQVQDDHVMAMDLEPTGAAG
ncbi:MAG: N-acetyltransferase family protein [Deltaproteobacteria bacterium]